MAKHAYPCESVTCKACADYFNKYVIPTIPPTRVGSGVVTTSDRLALELAGSGLSEEQQAEALAIANDMLDELGQA